MMAVSKIVHLLLCLPDPPSENFVELQGKSLHYNPCVLVDKEMLKIC